MGLSLSGMVQFGGNLMNLGGNLASQGGNRGSTAPDLDTTGWLGVSCRDRDLISVGAGALARGGAIVDSLRLRS